MILIQFVQYRSQWHWLRCVNLRGNTFRMKFWFGSMLFFGLEWVTFWIFVLFILGDRSAYYGTGTAFEEGEKILENHIGTSLLLLKFYLNTLEGKFLKICWVINSSRWYTDETSLRKCPISWNFRTTTPFEWGSIWEYKSRSTYSSCLSSKFSFDLIVRLIFWKDGVYLFVWYFHFKGKGEIEGNTWTLVERSKGKRTQ